MLWRARTSLARAAPWALATTWSRSSCSPAGLALAARTTTSLLKLETAQFQGEPRVVAKNFKLVLAGTALGALISSEADCMPQAKKKAKTDSKPAAAKKPGPALSALEAALQPEKVYNVEKLLASRLAGGKKEYKVRWEGYGAEARLVGADGEPLQPGARDGGIRSRQREGQPGPPGRRLSTHE